MKLLIVLAVLALGACAGAIDNIRASGNRQTFIVAQEYTSVYRVVTERSINCEVPGMVHSALFQDVRTAHVLSAEPFFGKMNWLVEIREVGPGRSSIDVYAALWTERLSTRIATWLEKGTAECR